MSRAFRIVTAALFAVGSVSAPAGAAATRSLVGNDPSSGGARPTHAIGPNALCDPGFEAVAFTCWEWAPDEETWAGIVNDMTLSSANPASGSYSADACGDNTAGMCAGLMRQKIQLPDVVTEGQMSAYVAGTTTDTTPGCSSRVGVIVGTVADFWDEQVWIGQCEEMDGDYASVESTDQVTAFLQQHQGEEVWVAAEALAFEGVFASVAGRFYVDDVFFSVNGYDTETYNRSVGLTLRRHLAATGWVTLADGAPAACNKDVVVRIQRKVKGKWRVVEPTVTNSTGKYVNTIPDKPGTYRAVAPSIGLGQGKTCAKAVSPTRKHSH